MPTVSRAVEKSLACATSGRCAISATLWGLGLHINPSKREMRRLQPWSDEVLNRSLAEEEALIEQARVALERAAAERHDRAEQAPQAAPAEAPPA